MGSVFAFRHTIKTERKISQACVGSREEGPRGAMSPVRGRAASPAPAPVPAGSRAAAHTDRRLERRGRQPPPALPLRHPGIAVAWTLRMLWQRPAQNSQAHQGAPVPGFALRCSQALVWISAFKLAGRLCV